MADNYKFDIAGAPLSKALDIATTEHSKVTHWRVEKTEDMPRLILYWTDSSKATPLPAPLEGSGLTEFIKSWLDNVEYGTTFWGDAETGKGCRVFNEDWGHVGGEWQAFFAVEPYLLLYGK